MNFRHVAATAVVSALLIPATVTSAEGATTNGNVYGVVKKSDGWVCPGKFNKVVDVRYFNHTTGKQGGDGNDDIVYIPVRLKINNSLTIGVKCRFGTYMAMNYTIKPTRTKQTFFFNLNGRFTSK